MNIDSNRLLIPVRQSLARKRYIKRSSNVRHSLQGLACNGGCAPEQLNGIKDTFKKVKKAVTKVADPLGINKKVKKIVGKYAGYIAPVASVFGPWGKAVAVGVAVQGAQYQKSKQKGDQLKALRGSAASLLSQYDQLAGTTAGRLIGTDTMLAILEAALRTGGYFDAKPKDTTVERITKMLNSCDKKCGVGLIPAVRDALADGAQTADEIMSQYFLPAVDATWENKWIVPKSAKGSQILLDLTDAIMAQENPNIPFSYGVDVDPTIPGVQPVIAPQGQKTPIVSTPAIVTPISPVPDVTQGSTSAFSDTQALIDSLMSQGASGQQMFNSALNLLAQKGVQPTQQVQAAVADQINSATKTDYMPWLIGGVLGIMALTMFSSRRTRNPRKVRAKTLAELSRMTPAQRDRHYVAYYNYRKKSRKKAR